MALANSINPNFDEINLNGISITVGTGAPTASASKGSLFVRTDGSSGTTRLYINTDGATTWTSVTTTA